MFLSNCLPFTSWNYHKSFNQASRSRLYTATCQCSLNHQRIFPNSYSSPQAYCFNQAKNYRFQDRESTLFGRLAMGIQKWMFFTESGQFPPPLSKAWTICYSLLINRMPNVFLLIQVINTKILSNGVKVVNGFLCAHANRIDKSFV